MGQFIVLAIYAILLLALVALLWFEVRLMRDLTNDLKEYDNNASNRHNAAVNATKDVKQELVSHKEVMWKTRNM